MKSQKIERLMASIPKKALRWMVTFGLSGVVSFAATTARADACYVTMSSQGTTIVPRTAAVACSEATSSEIGTSFQGIGSSTPAGYDITLPWAGLATPLFRVLLAPAPTDLTLEFTRPDATGAEQTNLKVTLSSARITALTGTFTAAQAGAAPSAKLDLTVVSSTSAQIAASGPAAGLRDATAAPRAALASIAPAAPAAVSTDDAFLSLAGVAGEVAQDMGGRSHVLGFTVSAKPGAPTGTGTVGSPSVTVTVTKSLGTTTASLKQAAHPAPGAAARSFPTARVDLVGKTAGGAPTVACSLAMSTVSLRDESLAFSGGTATERLSLKFAQLQMTDFAQQTAGYKAP